MTATYNPDEAERLVREARELSRHWFAGDVVALERALDNITAMVDQLEGARQEIDRIIVERDDARQVAAATIGDGAVRRWEESIRIQRQQEHHIHDLVTERDGLKARAAEPTRTLLATARSGAAEAVHDHDQLVNENEQLRARLEHANEAYRYLAALELRVGDVVDEADVALIGKHLEELRQAVG